MAKQCGRRKASIPRTTLTQGNEIGRRLAATIHRDAILPCRIAATR